MACRRSRIEFIRLSLESAPAVAPPGSFQPRKDGKPKKTPPPDSHSPDPHADRRGIPPWQSHTTPNPDHFFPKTTQKLCAPPWSTKDLAWPERPRDRPPPSPAPPLAADRIQLSPLLFQKNRSSQLAENTPLGSFELRPANAKRSVPPAKHRHGASTDHSGLRPGKAARSHRSPTLQTKATLGIGCRANGAKVFLHPVRKPSLFGIATINKKNKITKIIEKPKKTNSNLAVTGLYFFDNNVVNFCKSLKPSKKTSQKKN